MKVFIYATEGLYQGLHGIEAFEVTEVGNLKEAECYAEEMAQNLIDDYGLEEEYEEFEPEFNYSIYAIADEYLGVSTADLNDIAGREGHEDFIRDYCGEELA